MSTNDNNEPRLDRIEGKIDKLSDAMISLARSEEKIISLQQGAATTAIRLNTHSQRIDDVETSVKLNSGAVGFIKRIFWIALTAMMVTIFGKMIFGIELVNGI